MAVQPRLDILVVEDDEDIRTMLCMALEDDGYTVEGVMSAQQGLERLRVGTFHMVITDYSLPGHNGAWLLQEALRDGYLEATERLMITGHPYPSGVEGVTVLRKPLDLDDFFSLIHTKLAPAREAETARIAARLTHGPSLPMETARPQIELVLYISSYSPSSLKALRTVERILGQVDRTQVNFSVCDLSKEPNGGEEDRIAFTPTLVKRYPEPRTWIRGDLESGDLVADLLRYANVESRDGG